MIGGVGTIALLLSASGEVLHAQRSRGPTFYFEPGVITVDAVSPPVDLGSATGLNLRFITAFPTSIPWLTLLLGTRFAPLGLSNGQDAFNEPAFFYGASVMLLPRDRTAGWVELSLPVLGMYQLDETGEEDRLYVHDLAVQASAVFPVGSTLMADLGGFWPRFTLYLLAEQNLTPGRDFLTQRVDRFRPLFQYGVSIPIGGGAPASSQRQR